MMRLAFSKFPLLKSLIFQQLTLVLMGAALAGTILWIDSRAKRYSRILEVKERIVLELEKSQEEFRTWRLLNMEDTLQREFADLKQRLPISFIDVVDKNKLPPQNMGLIRLPQEGDSSVDSYLIARVDETAIHSPGLSVGWITLVTLGLLFFFATLLYIFTKSIIIGIYMPVWSVLDRLSLNQAKGPANLTHIEAKGEISEFITNLEKIHNRNLELIAKEKEFQKAESLARLSAQVAHDIRSPLAALDMILADLNLLPEDQRVLVQSAVGRIRDTANNLLKRNRSNLGPSFQLLSPIIQDIISETRLQYRSRPQISIDVETSDLHFLDLAKVNPAELKTVLSNLINNSVEAIENEGRIRVALSETENELNLTITDSGKGIPAEVLPKLMEKGMTYGKKEGNGLGLYHSRKTVESWGGSLELNSKVGEGTTVSIKLPKLTSLPTTFDASL